MFHGVRVSTLIALQHAHLIFGDFAGLDSLVSVLDDVFGEIDIVVEVSASFKSADERRVEAKKKFTMM
jgi:hypothetical protein